MEGEPKSTGVSVSHGVQVGTLELRPCGTALEIVVPLTGEVPALGIGGDCFPFCSSCLLWNTRPTSLKQQSLILLQKSMK